MKRIAVMAALAGTLLLPALAEAQGGPGFLFNRPRVSIGFRTGYTLPRASSRIFERSRVDMTLNNWDFSTPYFGGELAARVSERWDIALVVGGGRKVARSEYREFVEYVGQDTLPIRQSTTSQNVSADLGVRYYFRDRGRTVGRFAWVPSRLTPFVGAGVGNTWYTFEQAGDFIQFSTMEIFTDRLETRGSGAAAYASAGADYSIGKQFFLTGEARYRLSSGSVDGQYRDYGWIDLAGLSLTAGLAIRF